MELTAFKEALFARGKELGFTEMEIYYYSREQFTTKVFKGEVDQYAISVDGGLSFRGLFQGKMGSSYTEKVDQDSIEQLLADAAAGAQVIDSEEEQPIFAGSPAYTEVNLYNDALQSVSPQAKIDLLKQAEAECLAHDPRISMVAYNNLGSFRVERRIANTRGLDRSDLDNGIYAYVMPVAREGADTKSGMDFAYGRNFAALDPVAMAKRAAAEAVSLLGAEPVESREYPIILENRAAASLLSVFAGLFFAGNVQKSKSLLKGRLGQRIASELVTLVDDPFLAEGASSRSFDDEGVATRRLTLVENGVLKRYLYNLRTAAVDGVESTGHASKSSYKSAINTAPTNLYLQPGSLSFQELVESTQEGLIITSLQGLHSGANPISGDFSLAAHGYLVAGGKVQRAVNQITVAGNILAMLSQVEAVGNDLRFSMGMGEGYIGSPSLNIRSLPVAGK